MHNHKKTMTTLKNLTKYLTGKTTLAVVLPLLFLAAAAVPAFAQRANITTTGVYFPKNANTNETRYCVIPDSSATNAYDVGVLYALPGATGNGDPWKFSALIEYDQPYPTVTSSAAAISYPNHCLSLCMDVMCDNHPQAQSTYSIAFPLQNIQFQIFKYYNGKPPENADSVPPIRTIEMFPGTPGATTPAQYRCGSYTCNGGNVCDSNKLFAFGSYDYCVPTCSSKTSVIIDAKAKGKLDSRCVTTPINCPDDPDKSCYVIAGGERGFCPFQYNFNGNGSPSEVVAGETTAPMKFCAAWDGSYEIAGEFGKTNGQFGYRAYIAADAPGDNIAVDSIKFSDSKVYAGGGTVDQGSQYPIQIDVTNVHTVRSTPTVVGSITAVEAMPYTLAYRLSKDSDVQILIYDASKVLGANPAVPAGSFVSDDLRRLLVDWKPRLGEGMKGQESDKILVEFDSWDGRDNKGRLLPAGNYIASIQARTNDEWPGTDYSRATTRQVSIDPLKITDLSVTGLNKQSTAYATINYVPTESSKVYFNVYTPGTTFTSTVTNGSAATGTAPALTAGSGTLVYSAQEEREGRLKWTSKWDGLCGVQGGCTRTYANGEVQSDGTTCTTAGGCTQQYAFGSPMPDGNYVYALWAEIPYTDGSYRNSANGTPTSTAPCAANEAGCYTAVKTVDYKVGFLPLERGLVDITIQPVGYSTVGSSPTAYGLDPFMFKYSIARDATVVARVENSAGVLVKSLTPTGGQSNVAQQMNTLYWDGTDDQGRKVGPGTYMFTVQTKDAMFPSVLNKASAVFPVDLYHVVDVSTTDVYGDSTAKATISYYLAKAMNVQVNIYNKDVVIPYYNQSETTEEGFWPPRICNTGADAAFFTAGYVDPAKNPTCIYVNDKTFTNYPASAASPVDVRLQPVKTFDKSYNRPGDGMQITEEWDALYFYNPASAQCAGATDLTACKYEMVPDGQYPFYIAARSNEAVNYYYAHKDMTVNGNTYKTSEPFKFLADVQNADFIYTTEKPTSKINVTRGPVYFLDGSTIVYPNSPQLFNASSGPTFIPPYEINFSISRASTVEVEIVALVPNICTLRGAAGATASVKNNQVGDTCKHLSTTRILNTGNFDPNVVRKVYWDGTDDNGFYVNPAIYEVRLTAKNYPDENLYQPTIKSISLNVDLYKVFDLLEADGYAINQRNTNMSIGYQISVPMKVAIQIFKPGTTIFDYSKGTLRDPVTGREVTDIRDVLVRAIVGIRPATTLITELWDGRDYAQQEVPDGNYPFRFVTATTSADIDSVTGEIVRGDDASADPTAWRINQVADTYQYQYLHKATVAIGDGQFVCEDWEKTVFFYPNPFRSANGTLEVTKLPVPGTMSIKLYNLAGDMVRKGGYTCVDANNFSTVMGETLTFQPDNNISNTPNTVLPSLRNAALRCRWDKTNDYGRKVARGVYFGLVDFRAQNGRQHCQKVVKILIP